MWEYEHSAETTAPQQALWHRWSDMAAWPSWNDGIEKIKIDGPFAAGTTFTMTPPGMNPCACALWRSCPASRSPTRWTPATCRTHPAPARAAAGRPDSGDLPDRDHRPGRRPGRAGDLGPAITGDFPEVLTALVKLAEA
jgi:hypothetical protein